MKNFCCHQLIVGNEKLGILKSLFLSSTEAFTVTVVAHVLFTYEDLFLNVFGKQAVVNKDRRNEKQALSWNRQRT